MFKNRSIFQILSQKFVPALPSGDVGQILNVIYNIIPLKGQSVLKSEFQKELESSHKAGEWVPKVHLLPDVGKFEIRLNAFNPVLLSHGITSRYGSEVTLYKNRNRKMNRYLIYVYWRLLRKRSEGRVYWGITQHLIRNSSVYLQACIHSVCKNLYREKDLHYIERLLRRLNCMRANFHPKSTGWITAKDLDEQNLVQLQRHYIRFFRVYIPKGETVRPLGVPVLAWRVFMKMWLIPLVGYTGNVLPKNFHGYIPQRGTGSAWAEILTNVIHKANIYEVDFKQFFPSIPTDELLFFLVDKLRLPSNVALYLYRMNNSLPIFLTPEDKLPEVRWTKGHQESLLLDQSKLALNKPIDKERVLKYLSTTGLREPGELKPNDFTKGIYYALNQPKLIKGLQIGTSTPSQLLQNLRYKFDHLPVDTLSRGTDWNFERLLALAKLGIPVTRRLTSIEEAKVATLLSGVSRDTAEAKSVRKWFYLEHPGGVGLPQGSPLSPYLSILYLEMVLSTLNKPASVEYLFYADDGIFYSDSYSDLSNWLNSIFAPNRGWANCLSYFNIHHHPEKSGWVKIRGEWKTCLKFLGIIFVPGRKISDSRLVAATRSKKSTLEFDRFELLKFSYTSSLLYEVNAITIKSRLFNLKKYKNTSTTRAMIYYYESLLELHNYLATKVKTAEGKTLTVMDRITDYEYVYLLVRCARSGALSILSLFGTGAYRLDSKANSDWFLDFTKDDSRHLAWDRLNLHDAEKFQASIKYLQGGYIKEHDDDSTTLQLVRSLQESPIYNPSLTDVVDPKVARSFIEGLRKVLVASYGLLPNLDIYEYLVKRITGDGVLTPFKVTLVPLNLQQFILQVFEKYFDQFMPGFRMATPPYMYVAINRYFKINRWKNLVNSRYYGILFSRLYIGSWNLEEYDQDFGYTYKPNSLAEFLYERRSSNSDINIFVGSSYAVHALVKWSSHLRRTSRSNSPFRLFSEGFLPRDSWDVLGDSIELGSPSLASEFPGGQEPDWTKDR